jgi:hypothetical protein
MRRTLPLTSLFFGALLLALPAGCESETSTASPGDDAGSTSEGGTSDAGGGTDATTPDASSTDSGKPAGGKGLHGTGTYKGTAFTLACDFSDFNTGGLMCQDLQWYAFCRPVPNKVGDIDLFQLWFHLPSGKGAAATYDFKGVAGGGLKMGDGMSTPMDQDDTNATENVITVTKSAAVKAPIAGTFSAKWSDAGDGYGEVSGTFDFDCK